MGKKLSRDEKSDMFLSASELLRSAWYMSRAYSNSSLNVEHAQRSLDYAWEHWCAGAHMMAREYAIDAMNEIKEAISAARGGEFGPIAKPFEEVLTFATSEIYEATKKGK